MKCPECGAEMVLRETKKFRQKNGQPRKFYGCTQWPECKGTHGAHPNGEPLGIPGDAETKAWRHKAHIAFDGAFAAMPKKSRYKKLQEIMGMVEEDAHIAKFDISQCKMLISSLASREVK